MPDIFKEILPSILKTKKSVINDSVDEKDYNPYLVNKALSYHIDCIFYVNEMNMNYGLDSKMQYQFYMESIRSMNRKFQPWQKNVNPKELDVVKEFFGYSNAKAKEALKILSDEDIDTIRKKIDKGGIYKPKK